MVVASLLAWVAFRTIIPLAYKIWSRRKIAALIMKALDADVVDEDFAQVLRGYKDFSLARNAFSTYIRENEKGDPYELLREWKLWDIDL